MSVQEQTLVIELNEFNLNLLRQAAESLGLKSLRRILSFQHGITMADQLEEHQGLDPWVQWVSVHTETPSQEHGILRLGDVSKLDKDQIWERLDKLNVKTGVWGLMNASRKNSPSNHFFVADPWTFTEVAYPPELNGFLALPVYFAKNYLDPSLWRMLTSIRKTSWFLLRNIKISCLLSDIWFLLRGVLKTRNLGTYFLFCAYELLSVRVFTKYRDVYKPQVNFIFLNSIAHFQHHDWSGADEIDAKSAFVFRSVDRMLSLILPAVEASERVLVLNGLSQRNVSRENLYCYRQINPERFLHNLNLKFERVEQCMTNDAHVFFSSTMERERAFGLLSSATVAGQPAFFVENDSEDPFKLFYQVAVWNYLEDSVLLKFNNKEMLFFSEFAVYAKRTGSHIPLGSYFVNGLSLPESVGNSEILSYVWPKESHS